MLRLTNAQTGLPIAIERSEIKAVEARSDGSLLVFGYTTNRGIGVKESYTQVLKALKMRGRRAPSSESPAS